MGSSYPKEQRVMPEVAVQQTEAQRSTQLSDFKKARVRLKEESGWESPPLERSAMAISGKDRNMISRNFNWF